MEEGRDARGPDSRVKNDVSWYSRNPSLLMAAGSLPFPYRPGMGFQWITPSIGDAVSNSTQNIPGVCVLNWMPTVGYSQAATDPASVVGKEMFAKVREKFSGSIDADAPDFVIYVMALDSIFSYIAYLKRLYRILTAYTSENHFIPDGLLQAMGLTSQVIVDLKENRMQLYQIINELVYMTRKFNVPAVFDIINRHYWLSDNVYLDADTVNSQFYVFNCVDYYKFSLQETPDKAQAGGLSMVTITYPTTGSVEYLFQFGRSLIDALAGSDDAYIISGYLMRAYEGSPVFQVDELTIDDRLVPHYDTEVLMQIENASPLMYGTSISTTITNSVSQDPKTNAVLCKPHATGTQPTWLNGNVWKQDNFLSIRSDSPTVADVTIATRLKMGVSNDSSTASTFSYDIICGSEILKGIEVYYTFSSADGSVENKRVSLGAVNVYDVTQSTMTQITALAALESFDWHPILTGIIFATSSKTLTYTMMLGDVHNATLLTSEVLRQLNRVCLYSEFNAYGQI